MTDPKIFKAKGGPSGYVSPEGNPWQFARDLSNCIGPIVHNGIIMEQNRLEKSGGDTEYNMETLDTVSQFFVRMFRDSREDLGAWINGFEELYSYIQEREKGPEIYGSVCSFIVLNMYSFLFTSAKNGLKTGDNIEKSDYTKTFLTSALSITDKREEFMKEFAKVSAILPVPPMDMIAEESNEYLTQIKNYQQEMKNNGDKS